MQPVLLNLGAALHVPGLMALLTLPVCLLAGEPYAAPALLATGALSVLAAQVVYRRYRHAGAKAQVRTAMMAAVAAWLLIPLICAMPLLSTALALPENSGAVAFRSVANAWLEAMSGSPWLWRRAEHVLLLALLPLGSLISALENRWYLGDYVWRDSAFQSVSALTTAGFSTAAISGWRDIQPELSELAKWPCAIAASLSSRYAYSKTANIAIQPTVTATRNRSVSTNRVGEPERSSTRTSCR